jgi:hypothetical protein
MNNHSRNLKRTILVLSGIIGGLAVATTVVSCAGDTANTVAETASTDQSQAQPNTSSPQQPPQTTVVYVTDKGTVASADEGTNNPDNTPTVENDDSDEPGDPVEVPTENDDSDEPGDPVEVPTENDDSDEPGDPVEVPTAVEVPTENDDSDWPVIAVTIPKWWNLVEEFKPWDPIDICEKLPTLCKDKELLVELPEPCDFDEGTCPNWVIEEILDELPELCNPAGCPVWFMDDLIKTFESFTFEYSSVDKAGPSGPVGIDRTQLAIPGDMYRPSDSAIPIKIPGF